MWLVVVVVAACNRQPHVVLPAPPPNLTPDQRVAAYVALQPASERLVTNSKTGVVRHSITLANGTTVYHAIDLEPIVAPGSQSALAITRIKSSYARAATWRRVALYALAGTVGVVAIGLALDHPRVVAVGALVGVPTMVIAGLGAGLNNREAARSTFDVYDGYARSLAQRLGVCVAGLGVVPCEQSGGPPGAQPAPQVDDETLRSLRPR